MLTHVTLSQKSIFVQHCGNVAQVHDKCVKKDFIQGDQKVSVHLTITAQKTCNNTVF